ncbi:MAG: glycosyltransferase family 4 protein [Desulfococcaceae bacterium]|jgi:glycosyltransferase involved in cell wall biosynthesis|nr:glycosyltransferase family 4 protein [Desulfococcaceae bacterium]
MHIAFHTPFKALHHPRPSGDLSIARSLYTYFQNREHDIRPVSSLRTRWIYHRPGRWPALLREYRRSLRKCTEMNADIWLSYHCYYKAPDLTGPFVSRRLKIPYVIFQGIYSTKRRKKISTWPGFMLNRYSLLSAVHVFSNRKEDYQNLSRLLPEERLSYVAPGIFPQDFSFDAKAGEKIRAAWGAGDTPVILSAAMFRPDVKTQGLAWLIRACGRLRKKGLSFCLKIAGGGKEKPFLTQLAQKYLPGEDIFVGRIPRNKMQRFYSAGDIFAFPGIRESLGMVFLESQSCGLPVLAFDNGGIPEVVQKGGTGFLVPPFDGEAFDRSLEVLLCNKERRKKMGETAALYVRKKHDLLQNYRRAEEKMEKIIRGRHIGPLSAQKR